MTGPMMIISFVVLMLVGMPIGYALGIAGTLGVIAVPGGSDTLPVLPQQMYRSLDSFTFLAIPLFLFAGGIMAHGGVAKRLMGLASATVGRGHGGLGAAVVVGTMLFSGISGSSTADTAAVGRVVLPELKRSGYPLPFGTAIVAAAGGAAALIPPSIDMVIVGIVANISIAGLFAAGFIPAVLNAVGLMAAILFISRRRGYGLLWDRVSSRQLAAEVRSAVPAMTMVLIVLGGIIGGVFTPTEAAAVAVVYGLFVTMVVYRELKPSMLIPLLRETVQLTGIVVLIISMGAIFSYAMTVNQIPQQLVVWMTSVADERIVFLFLVQALFFIISLIMDELPALIILMPILTPIAVGYGIDPIHFGILVIANVGLGMAAPPVGVVLYAACAVAKLPLERVIRPILPFIAVLVVTLFFITYFEGFALFLPTLLGLR